MSEEKLFDFESITKGRGRVVIIQQSPMIDIVAAGFVSGSIVLANILYNEKLLEFQYTSDAGPVKSISFLSDQGLGVSLLASTTDSSSCGGKITLWDLNEKKIHSTLDEAHSGKQVSHIHFLQNEPVLVSSSNDGNSIKMW